MEEAKGERAFLKGQKPRSLQYPRDDRGSTTVDAEGDGGGGDVGDGGGMMTMVVMVMGLVMGWR